MTRPIDKHIDDDELDGLVSLQAAGVTSSGQLSEQAVEEAQRHVESCQDCHRKVQMHKLVQSKISSLVPAGKVPQGPECIGDSEWIRVAAGLLPETRTRELMKHAAQCGHCGPLLRTATETLLDDATLDEEQLVASLNSAHNDWQTKMAETLTGRIQRPRQLERKDAPWWQWLFSRRRPAFAAAVLAVVAVGAWFGMRMFRPPSAEQLLAQAYTERRTLEVRIPGAKYAPMRVERTSGGSSLDKAASLLKAEALIGENLRKSPNDPAWLQAKARADLLDGNYESAIKSLRLALETQPDSPELLTDLGSAYFLRAEAGDRAIDYGAAVNNLSLAIAKSPDDAVAVFNRAVVCEKIFLYQQAIEDWEHYLVLDPAGAWSTEARDRLTSLRAKLKSREQGTGEPLLEPKAFSSAPNDVALGAAVESKVEEYLGIAVRDWLPKVYPTDPSVLHRAEGEDRALHFLADLTIQKHGDFWLRDLLKGPGSNTFRSGVLALSQAVKASDAGDYSQAYVRATQAGLSFAAAGSQAGVLRAQVEGIYALHLSHEGKACLRAVAIAAPGIESHSYRWLRIQFLIEQSICQEMMGELGNPQQSLKNAMADAEQSRYNNIYLRAVGNASDAQSQAGNRPLAFRLALGGLARFWNSAVPAMQGYNLYTHLYAVAESQHQARLQVLVWQQALGIIDHDQDYLLRAMAHSTMARAALTASMPELAAKELAESAELFARAPQTRATLNDKVEAQTQLARVEALLGRPDEALSLLKGLQAYLRTLSNNYVAIKFYSTLGEVYLKRGEDAEADTALKSAVALSELGARSLQSERDRLTWTEATAGSYRGLVELKIRQGNVHDALETWEWSRAVTLRTGNRGAQEGVAYAAWSSAPLSSQMLADGPALPEPNEVARLLPTLIHETIISYGLFPDGISIWLYDNRGVVHRWVPKASSEILGIVNRFRDLCADRTSDIGEVQREARRLYALLIEPVENSIALDRTLEIEADEQLRGIPMEALLDSQNRYLSDRVTVMNSVGIYYRSYLRPSITISAQSPVLITAVSGAGVSANLGLPLLPDALKEGEQIAQRFFAAHLLEESQATTKALYNELPSAQVFHFAGHGVPSPDGTQLAFFDKPLSASSLPVSGLQRLQLAVLSACNTQRDFTAESVDSEGFIRKFVRAKVPYVVASRWAVDSAMSTRFMEIFYQNLLSGHTPAESIGLAQQSLHFNNRFGHPYYWAAFSTYGAFN